MRDMEQGRGIRRNAHQKVTRGKHVHKWRNTGGGTGAAPASGASEEESLTSEGNSETDKQHKGREMVW